MKKLATLLVTILTTLVANAQKLDGEWVVNGGEFNELLQVALHQEGINMKLGLAFKDTEVKVLSWINAEYDGVLMEMTVSIPGTYEKDGDQYSCDFDTDRADFEITDLKTDEPELSELLANPATKAMVLRMVKSQAQEETSMLEDIVGLSTPFRSFTIKEISDKYLEIFTVDEVELSLIRK